MKSTKRTFEEDQKLQEFARTPNDKKPHFDWGGLMTDDRWNETNILVGGTGTGETAFSIEEVADTIGNALTNLLLSREEQDIFSEKKPDVCRQDFQFGW
jgi:ribonucleoside-diphosphate reductase alpha chain